MIQKEKNIKLFCWIKIIVVFLGLACLIWAARATKCLEPKITVYDIVIIGLFVSYLIYWINRYKEAIEEINTEEIEND